MAERNAGAKRFRPNWHGLKWLAIALFSAAAVYLGVRLLLYFLFLWLFHAWGIDAGNVALAPDWARAVFASYPVCIAVVAGLALLLLSRLLRKWWIGDGLLISMQWKKEATLVFFLTLLVTVLPTLVYIWADSLRLQASGGRAQLFALILWLIETPVVLLAEECFSKRVVYDGLVDSWGRGAAVGASALVFFVFNRGYTANAACAVNVLLLGVLAALLYEWGGLATAVMFRFAWSVGTSLLFGNGEVAPFKTYGISEIWLTGGDAGIVCGWGTTVLLCAGIALLVFRTNIWRLRESKTK